MADLQGTLEDLALGFSAQQPNPYPVQNGQGMIDYSKPNKAELFNQNMKSLSDNYLMAQKLKNRRAFLKDVHSVMATGDQPKDKIEKLMLLKARHGDDYGLGMDDIVKQYKELNEPAPEWKPTTQEEAIAFERAKNSGKESPMLEALRQKRTEALITDAQMWNAKREDVNNALDSAQKVWGGIAGKGRKAITKTLGIGDPMLKDWQNVKMVLTDATLLNTAKTKGAISDREMMLFQEASANDDLYNIQEIIPVMKKLVRFMNAEQAGRTGAYKEIYGRDPMTLQGMPELTGGTVNDQGDLVEVPAVTGNPQVDELLNELGL